MTASRALVAGAVRDLRGVYGWSQATLGERIGYKPSAASVMVSRLENRATNLTLDRLDRVAAALELPAWVLLADLKHVGEPTRFVCACRDAAHYLPTLDCMLQSREGIEIAGLHRGDGRAIH